jgi:hypothetical protein
MSWPPLTSPASPNAKRRGRATAHSPSRSRRTLELLAAADRQGLLAGEVAQALWPDSPGWTRASKGVAHGRGTAVRGKTMPMVAGVLLARLRRQDLVRRDDRFAYHLTDRGRQALNAHQSPFIAGASSYEEAERQGSELRSPWCW